MTGENQHILIKSPQKRSGYVLVRLVITCSETCNGWGVLNQRIPCEYVLAVYGVASTAGAMPWGGVTIKSNLINCEVFSSSKGLICL